MSADNKFNLLASLTSLPDDGKQDAILDDDNMLPPLAIDEDEVVLNNNHEPSVGDSISSNKNGGSADAKVNNTAQTQVGTETQSETEGATTGVGSLLSSSGLLTSLGSTAADVVAGGGGGGGGGGGLFDQLEQEEERKEQEKTRKEMLLAQQKEQEEQQRVREAKEKAAAEAAEVEKEKERATIAAAAQAAAKAAVEESMVMSTTDVNNNNVVEGSVMGGMQELSLNGESTMSLGYRPETTNNYSNLRQDNHVNGSMQHQQPVNNFQNQQTTTHYPSQQPPPIPQEQPPPIPPQEQQSSMVQQQQQIQQAGYGASSYYYSTTGNVQQIHQQQTSKQQTSVYSPGNNNINNGSNNSVVQSQVVKNGMASSSYAERSNMMQNSHYQPSQNGHIPPQYNNQQQQQLQQPPQQQHMHQQQPPPQHYQNQQPYQNNFPKQYNGQGMIHNNHHPQNHQHLSNTNNTQHILGKPKIKPPPYNPNDFKPAYGPITVTDPILVQSPGVFSGPPHWIYNVIVRDMKKIDGQDEFSPILSNVRRRFRHFVALEDRIRADCLGAILPPRPDKHPTRAIDEASARQSTQFALQRAKELETYLNGLRLHPLAGKSPSLQLFLTHPDHIGAAWPEVSSSIFTRLTEVGTSTAVKITEGTSAVMSELNNESQILAGEDNSELMALASSEGLRIGSVLQSIPRIEGAIAIVGELGERMSVNGLEIQKLVTNVLAHERELSKPFECLASGLLRSGRRTTRLAIELGAASQVFTMQHKLCRYERMAFADRRSALVRRRDSRLAADKKVQKLVVHQHSMQSMGHGGMMDGVSREAQMSEEIANDAFNDAEQVGQILKCEVGRIADMRKKDWSMSLKVIAANMREAHAERAAIWESCRNSLLAVEQNNTYETTPIPAAESVVMTPPESNSMPNPMQPTGQTI